MLNKESRKIVTMIRDHIKETTDYYNLSDEDLQKNIHDVMKRELSGRGFSPEWQEEMERCVMDHIRGWGPLGELLRAKEVTEIMVNRFDCIFVEKSIKEQGSGNVACSSVMEQTDVSFESEEALQSIMQKIAAEDRKEINQSTPIADAMLPDGSRVNMTFPPITLGGATLTIRKFPEDPMTLDKLIEYGTLPEKVANFLAVLVQCRYNILISGGTGSGKTSFLNALSQIIPANERVITIEDSAELQLRSVRNLIRMTKRYENSAGTGEITIRQLIRNALRMNPNRIVVGEVRGAEAMDMLQAMNTGHDGSLSTAHANSTEAMLSRLMEMVSEGDHNLSDETIRRQIASSLDVIIHLRKDMSGRRNVAEISEVVGYENGEIILNKMYVTGTDGSLVGTGNAMWKREKAWAEGLVWYPETEEWVSAEMWNMNAGQQTGTYGYYGNSAQDDSPDVIEFGQVRSERYGA